MLQMAGLQFGNWIKKINKSNKKALKIVSQIFKEKDKPWLEESELHLNAR